MNYVKKDDRCLERDFCNMDNFADVSSQKKPIPVLTWLKNENGDGLDGRGWGGAQKIEIWKYKSRIQVFYGV